MTYQPATASDFLSRVEGLAFCEPTLNTLISIGTDIPFSSVNHIKGNFLTISSGAIVLPSGGVYYVEGTSQAMTNAGVTNSDFLKYQWHDGAGFIGNEARLGFYYYSGQMLETGDEKCIALIDTTAGSVSLTLRVTGIGGNVYKANGTDAHHVYAGYGRALVMKLEAP